MKRGQPLRAPGEAWLDGKEVVDVSLKIKDGLQWVRLRLSSAGVKSHPTKAQPAGR